MNKSVSLSFLLEDISKPQSKISFEKTTEYEKKVGVRSDELSAKLSIIASTDYDNNSSSIMDVNKSFVIEFEGTSYFFIHQNAGENGRIRVFRTHPSNKAYNFKYIGSCSSQDKDYIYFISLYEIFTSEV
ncbi:hypothetical protein [Acetoanaerobium sticklandii]|uniref:hypothetical protein n=1 Tax=Acetoanaerobium sticklandii TaxID=1511 RepID=UPI003A8F64F1